MHARSYYHSYKARLSLILAAGTGLGEPAAGSRGARPCPAFPELSVSASRRARALGNKITREGRPLLPGQLSGHVRSQGECVLRTSYGELLRTRH